MVMYILNVVFLFNTRGKGDEEFEIGVAHEKPFGREIFFKSRKELDRPHH